MKLYLLFIVGFLFSPVFAHAQTSISDVGSDDAVFVQETDFSATLPDVSSETRKGVVTNVSFDDIVDGNHHMVFTVLSDGETFEVDTRQSFTEGIRYPVRVGKKVYIQVLYTDGAVSAVFFQDIVRVPTLLWLAGFFVVVVVAVGRMRGLTALLGLTLTFAILFGFVIPTILHGRDPVLITMIASVVILAVNMHVSHGFHRSTLFAFFSTVLGVFIAWLFSEVFVMMTHLSGLASEEAILLQYNATTVAAPTGILLSAIILGAVGVLDDIAITQSETVEELQRANPSLSKTELFRAAMRIGRHHIASTVNTLVLAYVGVALPLFLLYVHTQGVDVWLFLNEEPVAEEIVRTLAGTSALILTVPIATWFATVSLQKK